MPKEMGISRERGISREIGMQREMGTERQTGMAAGGHLCMQTNETQNAVVHYRRHPSGTITEVERTSTNGAGSGPFKPISGQESAPNAFECGASVVLTPDRRFLFATNGGANSVSSFGVDEDGRLTWTPSRRETPSRDGAAPPNH